MTREGFRTDSTPVPAVLTQSIFSTGVGSRVGYRGTGVLRREGGEGSGREGYRKVPVIVREGRSPLEGRAE